MSDAEVSAFVKEAVKEGFRRNEFYYYDHHGYPVKISQKDRENPNFQVIKQNFYVQFSSKVWIYVLGGQVPRAGMKLQLQSKIYIIKSGIPDSLVPISDCYKAGESFSLV
jgi:hypothetical protein